MYELIALIEQFDGDAEVRIAIQPGDPMESAVDGAVDGKEIGSDQVIYIVEGDQLGNTDPELWTLA